jgi:multisubunit Na+/H+ antiporter MnhF subunit
MKKYNVLLGIIGYILTVCVAPALFIEKHYILALISFIGGIAVIDYNRGGN